jgi:hypothetical protein
VRQERRNQLDRQTIATPKIINNESERKKKFSDAMGRVEAEPAGLVAPRLECSFVDVHRQHRHSTTHNALDATR